MSTSYIAFFRGGPLGGEEREMPWPPLKKIEVPSIQRPSFVETSIYRHVPVRYEKEIYHLGRSYGNKHYEYQWENPAQGLREKVKSLEEVVSLMEGL